MSIVPNKPGSRTALDSRPHSIERLEDRRLLSTSAGVTTPRADAAAAVAPMVAQSTDVRTITLGETVTGAIESAGDTDELQFTAAAGERVYLDVSQLTGNGVVTFSLQDAADNVLGGSAAGVGSPDGADFQDAVTLTNAGDYKLVMAL